MTIDKPELIKLISSITGKRNQQEREAIQSITKLLGQIDYSAELVPASDPDRLIHLLVSLKGGPLTLGEEQLVREITTGNRV